MNGNNNNNNNSTNHSSHVHVVRDVPGRPDLTLHFSIVVPPGQNSSQIDNRFISAISRSLVQRLPTLLNDNGSPTGMLFGATVRPLNRSGDGDNSRTPSNNSASASQSENSSGSGRGINSSRVRLTPNLLLPHGGFAEWMDQLFNNAESRPKPADADAIATLPTGKPTIAQLQAKAECCICKDLFVELDIGTTLPCDHFFHKECVETWLGRSHTCPLCRFELPVAKEPAPSSSSAQPPQQQQQQSSSSSSNNMPNVNASGAFAVPVMPPSFLPLHALFQHLAQSIRARTAEAVDSPAPRQSRNNNTSSSNTASTTAVSSSDVMTRSRSRRSSSISNSRSATTTAAADTSNDAVAAASTSVRRTRVRRRRPRALRRSTASNQTDSPLPIRPLPPIVSSSIPPPLPTRNQSSSSSASSTTTNQSSAPVSSRTRRRQTTSQQSRKRSRL